MFSDNLFFRISRALFLATISGVFVSVFLMAAIAVLGIVVYWGLPTIPEDISVLYPIMRVFGLVGFLMAIPVFVDEIKK